MVPGCVSKVWSSMVYLAFPSFAKRKTKKFKREAGELNGIPPLTSFRLKTVKSVRSSIRPVEKPRWRYWSYSVLNIWILPSFINFHPVLRIMQFMLRISQFYSSHCPHLCIVIKHKQKMKTLENKVALVTGASKGIGAAIAAELAKN